jgi:hypothetical protein
VDVPGLVKGNVYENGNGGVTVRAVDGSFEGTVVEAGAGSVSVYVNYGMAFKGDVQEQDLGSVTAVVDGTFEGNITEALGGNVATSGAGWFKGNLEQELPGTCTNTIIRFEGSACF